MPDVGDSLGRYTLLRRLASGGMGEVYVAAKAGPVGFGPYVALKVLREELAVDQQFVDMLVDEANISMFLNHQNVVSVLDLSEDDGRYYIAMEFIQGVTVERLVDARVQAGKPPDIPVGLYIATELCRALKYAHTRSNHNGEPLNIVHRDVTPANILLSTQGEVKLTDFGIARAKGRIHQTQAGVLKGKFGYMAPEMVRYERIDARADIFCAGVVVYLMITGRHPVAGAAVMEAIQMFEDRRVPPPKQFNPEVTDTLNDIVMKALEPKVENRWASAAAFGDALQDVTLQNPAWRREVQDGARQVRERIREVAPEVFQQPVEQRVLDELLAEARRQNGGGRSLPFGAKPAGAIVDEERTDAAHSGAVTIAPSGPHAPLTGYEDTADIDQSRQDGLQPISPDMSFAPTPAIVDEPEFETEDSLKVSDIRAAVGPEESSRDTDEDDPALRRDSGASTMALHAVRAEPEPGAEVAFPESSTDRNKLHDDMMAEPALPSAADPSPGSSLDDKTVAGGYDFASDFGGATLAGPEADDLDMDDGSTVVGSSDEEDDDEFGAPTLAMGAVQPGLVDEVPLPGGVSVGTPEVDDSRTVAGVTMPDEWEEKTSGPGPEVVSADDYGDAATIIPSADQGLLDPAHLVAGDDWEGGTTEADEAGGDATLLDGLDANEVQAAMRARKSPGVALVRDESGSGDVASYDDLVRENTGDTSPKDPASFDPAESPRPFQGPVRIVMGDDGPALAKGQVPAADPAPPAWGGRTPAEEKQQTPGFGAGPQAPVQPARGPAVGPATGKWMAGEIEASALDWSDDAAARRAVAARNQQQQQQHQVPAPQPARHTPQSAVPQYGQPQLPPGYGPPGVVPPTYQPPRSFFARNWVMFATLGVAVALFATIGYLWFFTNAFWPKLKLDSTPQGAVITVDGSLVAGKTPLVVRVEPQKRHLIEFRLDGYKRSLREITEGIGRGRTYTLTVELERQPPRFELPVEGTLFINGAQAAQGRTILLSDLPDGGAVEIRIEAEGYKPYEIRFGSAGEIPAQMDIPLVKAE